MGLIQEVDRIAKEKGFKSTSGFINDWIQGGQTFASLRDYLDLECGVKRDLIVVWKVLRNYLTIPYDHEDQFWYKYNAIAKAKGFKDAIHMARNFKRKLRWEEMAEELGIGVREARNTIRRIARGKKEENTRPKRQYIRHKHKKKRDRNGISHKSCHLVWKETLKNHGFQTLRDAIWKLRRRGLTYIEIAKLLGVSERNLRYRRRRAGL